VAETSHLEKQHRYYTFVIVLESSCCNSTRRGNRCRPRKRATARQSRIQPTCCTTSKASEFLGIFEEFDYALEQTTGAAAVDAAMVEA
jgi:hypothetical protein